jgi:hypothetical protein
MRPHFLSQKIDANEPEENILCPRVEDKACFSLFHLDCCKSNEPLSKHGTMIVDPFEHPVSFFFDTRHGLNSIE